MTQVKVKNIKKVTDKINIVFESTVKSKGMRKGIGRFVLNRNKQFARSGKSLSSNQVPVKQKELTEFTKKLRAAIEFIAPELTDKQHFRNGKRSNVTFTGQLLDKLDYTTRKTSEFGYSIFLVVKGSRTKLPYKQLYYSAKENLGPKHRHTKILGFMAGTVKPSDQTNSNEEVYSNLKKLGFGFLGLDYKGRKRVAKIVLDEFRRNIKKFF